MHLKQQNIISTHIRDEQQLIIVIKKSLINGLTAANKHNSNHQRRVRKSCSY